MLAVVTCIARTRLVFDDIPCLRSIVTQSLIGYSDMSSTAGTPRVRGLTLGAKELDVIDMQLLLHVFVIPYSGSAVLSLLL